MMTVSCLPLSSPSWLAVPHTCTSHCQTLPPAAGAGAGAIPGASAGCQPYFHTCPTYLLSYCTVIPTLRNTCFRSKRNRQNRELEYN